MGSAGISPTPTGLDARLDLVIVKLDTLERIQEEKLDALRTGQDQTNQHLIRLNGTVQQNCTDIAILKATALRLDAGRIAAILAGVAVIVGGLLKAAGIL